MKKAAPAVLAALVLLLATACGGDDGGDNDALDATIIGTMTEAITTPGGILDADDAACVTKRFVDELGAEALQEAGVVTDDGSYNDNGANLDATTSRVYADAVLACVDQEAATRKIRQNLLTGAAASSLPPKDATCFITKLVATVGIPNLMSSQVVTDTGEINQNAADPDLFTAKKSTAALLGCIDYYARYAKERAAENKDLDRAVFLACLRRTVPESLWSKFLTSVTAETADQAALTAKVSKKTEACTKVATAK